MISGAEVALAIMAIYALIPGKLPLTRNRIVYGWKARVLALFGLLPFPLALTIGIVIGIFTVVQGQPVNPGPSFTVMLGVMELAIVVLCVAAMYGIGWASAPAPPPPMKRRRRDEPDDDEPFDDEPDASPPAREQAVRRQPDDAMHSGPGSRRA